MRSHSLSCMNHQKEIYGVGMGSVYFAGIGDAGFRLDDDSWATLKLTNARARTLQDPSVGVTDTGEFVWTEEHLKGLLGYIPNHDVIPSITLPRKGIDHLVAFLYHGEPALPK